MTRQHKSDAGFTLVEAMVSLFVFSLIAAGCVAMLMQSVESQRQVSEAHQALRELQVARALLAGDLAQIAPRSVRQADDSRRPSFVGGDAGAPLAFVRASAESDPERGAVTSLTYVEYLIEDGRVTRRSRAYLDATAQTPIVERVLLSHAEGAHFEFYDGAQWRDQWIGGAVLAPPRAVALVADLPRYGTVRLQVLVGL